MRLLAGFLFGALLLLTVTQSVSLAQINFWGPSGLDSVNVLALGINSTGHIFAGNWGRGVFPSTNNGNSWVSVNTGLTNPGVRSLAINPSGCIFAGTEGGVFRSVQATTSVREVSTGLPEALALDKNYPNPFNPSTTIRFTIQVTGFTTLKVYDVLGREVATLVSEVLALGSYNTKWDAAGFPSGVYLYRLQTGEFTETKKLLLLK